MSESGNRPPVRAERWLGWVFGGCLVYAAWALSVGWNQTLLGLHGFRQTQTAMAIEYLLAGSHWLRYETPFLGFPWSIPFEFPLYQWIAAAAVGLLGTPTAQTARFVSVGFFLATIPPLISLQGSLGVRGNLRLVLPSLLLTSPIYLFWSRTVLIESTALFFATSYLALLAAFLFGKGPGRSRTLWLAAACGAIGAMVKITTFATFLLAAIGLLIVAKRGARREGSGLHPAALLLGLLVPTVAGLAWTRFAEAQRELNPIAQEFLTGTGLSSWFLGTISDRLDIQAWETTLTRTVRHTIGNWGVLLGALFLSPAIGPRGRRCVLASLVLFLFAPALILHLHRIHEYYPYANAVFLLAVVSWAIVGALMSGRTLRNLGIGLFALALASCLFSYRLFYHRVQTLDVEVDHGLVTAAQRAVGVEGVMVILGWYWSPEMPYYIKRRAIMNRDNRELESPTMRRALEGLSRAGYRVEGLLSCHRARGDTGLTRRSVAALGLVSAPSYQGQDCDLYGLPR